MKKFWKCLPLLFAAMMTIIGIIDLTRPESFKAAMDGISMPHYILWILGAAKIIGGLVILSFPCALLVEWAYAGFFIWAIGGISSHLLSGHTLVETFQIIGISFLLIAAYICHRHSMRIAAHKFS